MKYYEYKLSVLFFREKVFKHQAEINRLQALKYLRGKQEAMAVERSQQSCYVRSFYQPPCMYQSSSDNLEEDDSLSVMLAELREGSEEI